MSERKTVEKDTGTNDYEKDNSTLTVSGENSIIKNSTEGISTSSEGTGTTPHISYHKRAREAKQAQTIPSEEPTSKRVRKPNTLYLGYEQDKKTEHVNKTLFGDGSPSPISSSKESKKESNHKKKRKKKKKNLYQHQWKQKLILQHQLNLHL